jgi:hypothetical protein
MGAADARRSGFAAFVGEEINGVLDRWSIGVMVYRKPINPALHFSITPGL